MSREDLHTGIQAYFGEEEYVVRWLLTVEVADGEGGRHLVHLAAEDGGTDSPRTWDVLGLACAAFEEAKSQMDAA